MNWKISRSEIVESVSKRFEITSEIQKESFSAGESEIIYFDEPRIENREYLSFALSINEDSLRLIAYLPFGVKPNLSSEALQKGYQGYRGNANYAVDISYKALDLSGPFLKEKLDDLQGLAFEISLGSELFILDENDKSLVRLSRWGSTLFKTKCRLISQAPKRESSNPKWHAFLLENSEDIALISAMHKRKSLPRIQEISKVDEVWTKLLSVFEAPDEEYKTMDDIIYAGIKARQA